jgi:hypothetical protein
MASIQNNVIIINETDPRFAIPGVIVAAGAVTSIPAGTPTKGADATAASWTGAVIPTATGGGTTADRFTGISKSDSTDTVAAAGVVTVWLPLPGYVYACKATTLANVNTAALLAALFGKRVTFTLTAGVYTINTAAADAAANMLVISGGDFNTGLVYFSYKNTGTLIGQIA